MRPTGRRGKGLGWLSVAAWAWAAWALVACSDPAGGKEAARAGTPPVASAVPVVVATAVEKPVPTRIQAIGTVQAVSTIQVKAQVSGELLAVHFREGQDVRRGDLLFTIDPRPVQAALDQAQAMVARDQAQVRQAEANAARDQAQAQQAEAALGQARAQLLQAQATVARDAAQLENARTQDGRYAELVRQELIAREQYDQIHTALEAAEATVKADQAMVENARGAITVAEALLAQARTAVQAGQAAIENAGAAVQSDQAAVQGVRLQLGYTEIRSPLDGRTGSLLVQPGNLVKANDVPILVTIAQTRPIYVAFAVPERSLDEVRRYLAVGPLGVEARPQGAAGPPARGQVTFVDNGVDATTGTIQVKASFPNADGALWPGQFVTVGLTLTTDPRAVVVPVPAVQAGQSGPYVFVVKADDTVEMRPVAIRATQDGEAVVAQGVRAGERVVTDGQLRLTPGARIEARAAAPAPASPPPPGPGPGS